MHLLAGLVWAHASLVSVPVSQHPDTARDRPLLRVLAINDFHGALEPQVWLWSGGRAVGGAAALKSWLDSLTRTCECATIRRGGVRVAVIGLALPETPVNTAPRNVRGLAFGDGAAAVRRVLPRARAGADYVIVVAHEGAFCDAACHGEIVDLARGLDSGSVDLIVSGDTPSP